MSKLIPVEDLRDEMYRQLDNLEWTVRTAQDEQDINGLVQMAQEIRSSGIQLEHLAGTIQERLSDGGKGDV